MKSIWIFLFLSCNLVTQAQSFPTFIVYLVNGNVTVDNASEKGKKVLQTTNLYSTDIIRIQKKSEVQLFNSDGKFIMLNSPGIYKVSDVEKKINTFSQPSITTKYLKLVYEQVLDPHYDISKVRKNAFGGAIGGAARGLQCNVLIYPPNGYKGAGPTIKFSWYSSTHLPSDLNIYDASKKQIRSVAVKDTQQRINLNIITKGKYGTYYWLSKPIGMECDTVSLRSFVIIPHKEQQKQIAAITGKMKTNSLIDQLNTIANLESAGFIDAAKERYVKLVNKIHIAKR